MTDGSGVVIRDHETLIHLRRAQEGDPRRLLQLLTATLAARGLALPLALFVPAVSRVRLGTRKS